MKRLVIKIGGHALDSLDQASPVLVDLAKDVARLREGGTDVLVVHGGGPQIGDLLEEVGLPSRFHEGLRITDARTMHYVAMALSLVNLRITAALNAAGLRAIGVSGVDDSTLVASSIGQPWDRAGGSPRVCSDLVTALWASGLTPVLSSVAVDEAGEMLNLNADTVAGALAGALDADALLLLSDIDQVRSDPEDPETSLARISVAEVREMIAAGLARDGMRPKVTAALDALDGGARRVIIANGTRSHAIRDSLAGALLTTEVTA